MRKIIIGIMWPWKDKASQLDLNNAYEIGKYCAKNNLVVLT